MKSNLPPRKWGLFYACKFLLEHSCDKKFALFECCPHYFCAMEKEIVNKVAASGLVTLELEHYLPSNTRKGIDLADQLFQGLILREKDFRGWLAQHPWGDYAGCDVFVHCSADAIVPQWAFMLVAIHLAPHAHRVIQGDQHALDVLIAHEMVAAIDKESFRDARVIIKGCSDASINGHAYTALTAKLQPVVKSLMFGEPCSTVPLYKRT